MLIYSILSSSEVYLNQVVVEKQHRWTILGDACEQALSQFISNQIGQDSLRTRIFDLNNNRSTALFARLPFDHTNRLKVTIRYDDKEANDNVNIVVQGAPKNVIG
jgi:magnesium-transporting ATPase (P-type)